MIYHLQRKILTMTKWDNLHINLDELESHKKPFNIVQSCRSSGKTTLLLKKIYKAYQKKKQPSIIIRRRINDLTESNIIDNMRVINKFAKAPIQFYYKTSDIKSGIVEVYLSEEDLKKKQNPFIRYLGLSAPMQRLKGGVLPNVRYILFDEFAINLKEKETYLNGEVSRFMELYTTYARESERLTVYFLGNSYSYYSPYHSFFNIDPCKIKMGSYVITEKCAYYLFKPSEELKEILKNENKLLGLDSSYDNYALEGYAINDNNIKIIQKQPYAFALNYVFKVNDEYIYIYKGNDENFSFWVDTKKENATSKPVFTFDLYNVNEGTTIPPGDMYNIFYPLKRALMCYKVAFVNITAYYLLETVYNTLPKL